MRIIRFLFFGYFAFLSMIFLAVPFGEIQYAMHGQNASGPHLNPLVQYVIPIVLATIFGVASWTALRESASLRVSGRWRKWTIAASLLSLSLSIGIPLLYYHWQGAGAFWYLQRVFAVPTAIGATGLIVFSRPYKQPRTPPISETHE